MSAVIPGGETLFRNLWEQVITFEENQTRFWHVGNIRFWVRWISQEWFVAFEEEPEYRIHPIAGAAGEAPAALSWHRYVAGDSRSIAVRPILPDRPIVIRPSSPVKILPGRESRYFIHLPVWLAIMEGTPVDNLQLAEHPGKPLSSTWFGNPDDGELCYSFTSDLYKRPEEREDLPLMAVCPITIRNGSAVTLDFQRVCVRAPHLHLYTGERFLCTNELELIYRGADQSQIDFSDSVPAIEAGLTHVTSPRLPVSRNVIKKSFEYFRSLY